MNSFRTVWCEQEASNTCGVAALRIALKYFGYNIQERELVHSLRKFGFPLKADGVYYAELALLAASIGFKTTMRVPYAKLNHILWDAQPVKNTTSVEVSTIDDKLVSSSVNGRYKRIIRGLHDYIYAGGRLLIHSEADAPGLVDILRTTKRGAVAIVRIDSDRYYGVYEKWGHSLVAVPHLSDFIILDCYTRRIQRDYPLGWGRYLTCAQDFEWRKWRDILIEIEPDVFGNSSKDCLSHNTPF